MTEKNYNILITSYLEPEFVAEIAAVDSRLNVVYRPDLIAPPRYIADHNGSPDFQRTTEQEAEWQGLLAQADILLTLMYGGFSLPVQGWVLLCTMRSMMSDCLKRCLRRPLAFTPNL